MRRGIVDFKKSTPKILSPLVDKYSCGYGDDRVIIFKNSQNVPVEAIETLTDDTVYLVKVSSRLETNMAIFEEEDYNDSHSQEFIEDLKNKLDKEG